MSHSRTVEIEGHIIDSGTMQRCFGAVMDLGGSFDVEQFDVGKHEDVESYCRMAVSADDPETLQAILHELHQNGAVLENPTDVELVAAPADKVVPPNFYSTTNHPTEVLYDGEWIDVERIEMDCALIVEPDGGPDGDPRAYTKVLNAVEEDDLVATDQSGIRVNPPERPRSGGGAFGFMQGGVSSERPSESTIREVAEELREVTEAGGNVMVVAGPAVIHSGAGDALAELVEAGYVDALSAGNGFATHDLERSLYGTSLGMDVETLEHPRKGHKHHIWTISEIIRAGGIEAAVEDGIIGEGVMYQCVQNDVDTVLAGSIRDDGPLPDTITDAVEAQNAIRDQAHDADIVLMLATLLHSVAVGNCLPSTTKTVCVDINPATVTQLLDRGSAQAVGMVTDIGTFVPTLAEFVLEGEEAGANDEAAITEDSDA
ncbi:ornithine cyclodeaminase, nickel-pincer nucleotide-dependent [Halorubrum lacusprofundi]|jgi:lysine-ketoglutarate reductase/saccharopine dehydrogenase-like protein (TIGR00300 family)|uniref:Ornithine cyclodeaminase n=1 Tax=Halorubrum lacusprofundi (strain ATCC 49239 / DSM 5036 / JCM 8891 / ACAM 34) TaxID=416348 RepID=B9LPI1_HALLT|nr:TIGR00300 family protein [Halorubrum lacusprofundi]ACM57269.1 LOR/SDH bifunctional protein conserved domain protein [Halorubrum lacusprofundi ATCC 49239]MCG1006121.1 TIGR00300 family protein [Halorubrum lacusprofundi]